MLMRWLRRWFICGVCGGLAIHLPSKETSSGRRYIWCTQRQNRGALNDV